MINRRNFIVGGLAIVYATMPAQLHAAQPEIYSNSVTGIAINGYDPVAYFNENMPVEGRVEHSHSWNGATWYFSSAENKAIFKAKPDKYAPQYGGYCAFAVSYGSTATTVPEAWSIVDNKLYLNNSLGVRSRWNTDQQGYIQKADKNWPNVLK